jgi:O-antigen/teichoic acid export membrane protein
MTKISGDSLGGKHLLRRASWTLVDQCVVSGGNFLLMVLLARALDEEDYGEFSLFLGGIFLLRTIDYSLISYPVSVRLCATDARERPRLLGNASVLAVGLSFLLMVLMAVGTKVSQADSILVPACLCFLCWQAQETSRRFLLADFRYREALPGDAVAYVGQALLIAGLYWSQSISLSSAIYAMSCAFALGALVHVRKLQFAWPRSAELRGLALDYFSLGRWSIVSYMLVLVRSQIFLWLLAAIAGLAATASLQAALNIANIMNPILFGIGNAVPQIAAQAHLSGGVVGAARATAGYVLFGLVPILVIGTMTVAMPDLLLRAVYGPSSPYLAVAVGLQFLAVAGVIDYIAEMASKTLLGMQAGRMAFLINAVACIAALVLGLALIGPLGVVGACCALLLANLVRSVGGMVAIAWLIAQEREKGQAGTATGSNVTSAD